jgi:hypothetical protein
MGRFNETVQVTNVFTYVLCAGFTQSAGGRRFVRDVRAELSGEQKLITAKP